MLPNKLITMVQGCYKTYNEDRVPFKLKSIWLNPNLKMSRRDKVILCNRINAEIRKGKSLGKITQAIREMIAVGLKINKAAVSKRSGVSRKCVGSHWDECMAQITALPEQSLSFEHKHTLTAIKGKDAADKNVHRLTRREYYEQYSNFWNRNTIESDFIAYVKTKNC